MKIRDLKRDVDYIITEVISDCYTCLIVHPGSKQGEVLEIIYEAVELRNNIFEKINHPVGKEKAASEERKVKGRFVKKPTLSSKLLKKHYTQLHNEIMTSVDALFTKLSNSCKA